MAVVFPRGHVYQHEAVTLALGGSFLGRQIQPLNNSRFHTASAEAYCLALPWIQLQQWCCHVFSPFGSNSSAILLFYLKTFFHPSSLLRLMTPNLLITLANTLEDRYSVLFFRDMILSSFNLAWKHISFQTLPHLQPLECIPLLMSLSPSHMLSKMNAVL